MLAAVAACAFSYASLKRPSAFVRPSYFVRLLSVRVTEKYRVYCFRLEGIERPVDEEKRASPFGNARFSRPLPGAGCEKSKGIAEPQINARGGGFCVLVGVDVEDAHHVSAEDADVAHIQCEAKGGLHIEPFEECRVGIPVSLAELTDEGVGLGR